MRRNLAAAALIAILAPGAAAQDGVRLRNGKFLSGNLILKEEDKEGFEIQRWDGSGNVFIRWTQIPEFEKARLLGKPLEAPPTAALVDALRVVTASRELTGLLVKEENGLAYLKVRDQKSPVPVPVSTILRRDSVRIPEAEIFSPEEMVDNRALKADPTSPDALLDLASFAASLKLYERAKEFLIKAAALDPARKDLFERRIAENEALIKEGRAAAALASVRKLQEEMNYPKALEEAKKFFADFADTELAKQNKDLMAALEKDAKDFESRRAEVLKEKVPDLWKAKRSSLLSQYASGKYKLSEARSAIQKLDAEIAADLAKRFKVAPEEVMKAWELRDPKPRSASYGSGTWIAKGGQDGGMDTDAKYEPRQRPQNTQNPFDIFGSFGGSRRRQPQQPKPVALGQKLQTSEEWWQTASTADRKNWLEAEYASTSSCVRKIKEETRKCPDCGGEGVLRYNRMGVTGEAKCHRCHGVQNDVIIYYQ